MDNVNNINSASIDNILAELKESYNDLSVITNDSQELQVVNDFFSSITCGNKEIENLLFEVIGYSISKTAKLNKAFIFKGNGRNGKSKVFRIIEALLGEEQCSHEHLENLSGNKAGSKSTVRFLNGCTVNIAEDQKQPKYINTSLITRIISGEPISIEQKGKEYDLKLFTTMLFSVNEVIDFKETGIYITDRFVVIPFNATFTDKNNNRNINIEEELKQSKVLQIIATKAVQAFNKVLENGKFTIPLIVEQETKEYFMECNNVVEFCNIVPLKTFTVKADYYSEYKKWCQENNRKAVSNSQFGKEVLALGYRAERYAFGSKRDTYYVPEDFDNTNVRSIYDKFLTTTGITEARDSNLDDKYVKETYNTNFREFLFNINFNVSDENLNN